MKCDRCFFCLHIGRGIYADVPVKYCRRTKQYLFPVVTEYVGVEAFRRKLDFNDMKDCKLWHNVGCNIHPSTVEKAKRDFIKRLEEEVNDEPNNEGNV